jgi:hypothetical protein
MIKIIEKLGEKPAKRKVFLKFWICGFNFAIVKNERGNFAAVHYETGQRATSWQEGTPEKVADSFAASLSKKFEGGSEFEEFKNILSKLEKINLC